MRRTARPRTGTRRARRLAIALLLAGFLPAADSAAQILLFSRTVGFRHPSIVDGIAMITDLAAAEGLALTTTEDPGFFNDVTLSGFSVVVWLSTTGDVLSAAQQAAFESYVSGGGGWVGIHAAADCEYAWPWYGELLGNGAWFQSHPVIQEARLRVDDREHPATDALPDTFLLTEEWYNFQANPRPAATVSLTVDETSYNPGVDAMGDDHPIAWWHEIGAGRSFYTALGHRPETYADAGFREQVRSAVLWAAGLLACSDARSLPVADRTVTAEEEFRACADMTVRDTRVSGASGHAILRAANFVALADGVEVGVDARLTVVAGQSLYQPP